MYASCNNIKVLCRGTFRMEREDGYTFDCRIPPFSLESKSEDPGATTGVM
jgi:uncharacterized protein affecting Mg2+/Co2+ transport